MNKHLHICILVLWFLPTSAFPQKERLTDGLEIGLEAQASVSHGKTPLWLNANKYGLSSLDKSNGYVRMSALRPAEADTARKWKWGYGIDVAAAANYTSTIVVQQAYGEMAWKKLHLTLGAKQQPSVMKNMELSSGALTIGWNARPIPQARLDVDWFSIPYTGNWWQWSFYGSYGMTTDGGWQKSVVPSDEHYTGNVLYHEKALYWKFGKAEHTKVPLTFEIGIQFATQFGGTTYNFSGRGYDKSTDIRHSHNLTAFIDALTFGGSDENDGSSENTAGNHIGSYNMRLTWHGKGWKAAARFERMFEDQSMLTVQYGIYDHLLGADIQLPDNRWVSEITVEHLSTRDQSGAILHDAAQNIPDKMNGRDNYYNHSMYAGYQHWGQTLGNPLLTSPVYNSNGSLVFTNNRITAWHVGLSGTPAPWLHWRALGTLTRNWGTYDRPLDDPLDQNYILFETVVSHSALGGWNPTLGIAFDCGKLTGNNFGAQITVRKAFRL